jgi:hypothetical protein
MGADHVLGSLVDGHGDSLPPGVNPPEAHQRRTAERLKAAWHELDTGPLPDAERARGADPAAPGVSRALVLSAQR